MIYFANSTRDMLYLHSVNIYQRNTSCIILVLYWQARKYFFSLSHLPRRVNPGVCSWSQLLKIRSDRWVLTTVMWRLMRAHTHPHRHTDTYTPTPTQAHTHAGVGGVGVGHTLVLARIPRYLKIVYILQRSGIAFGLSSRWRNIWAQCVCTMM